MTNDEEEHKHICEVELKTTSDVFGCLYTCNKCGYEELTFIRPKKKKNWWKRIRYDGQ